MQTRNKQRINVTIHRIDKWLDHPNGTATTLCGLVVQADISQQIIDMSEVVNEVSCPLCECAALLADVQLPEYEQPALF